MEGVFLNPLLLGPLLLGLLLLGMLVGCEAQQGPRSESGRISDLEARVSQLEAQLLTQQGAVEEAKGAPEGQLIVQAAARHCAALFGQGLEAWRREEGRYPAQAQAQPPAQCVGLEWRYQGLGLGESYRLSVGAGGRELARAGNWD